jgi:DNA-directed RNA polymerase subunit RPC12/RpoP
MERDIRIEAYKCTDCEMVFAFGDEGDSPLYECGECGSRYNRDMSADGNSNRCPDCNLFGARVAWHSCLDCGEGELFPLVRI